MSKAGNKAVKIAVVRVVLVWNTRKLVRAGAGDEAKKCAPFEWGAESIDCG